MREPLKKYFHLTCIYLKVKLVLQNPYVCVTIQFPTYLYCNRIRQNRNASFTENRPKSKEKFIIYTDKCGGQNTVVIKRRMVQSIEHWLFVAGHMHFLGVNDLIKQYIML